MFENSWMWINLDDTYVFMPKNMSMQYVATRALVELYYDNETDDIKCPY